MLTLCGHEICKIPYELAHKKAQRSQLVEGPEMPTEHIALIVFRPDDRWQLNAFDQ